MPATPAPTPFSIGPSGIRPEDLVAGISRLSVIQEQDIATIARWSYIHTSDFLVKALGTSSSENH